jgi:excisionase family DNA binding protein
MSTAQYSLFDPVEAEPAVNDSMDSDSLPPDNSSHKSATPPDPPDRMSNAQTRKRGKEKRRGKHARLPASAQTDLNERSRKTGQDGHTAKIKISPHTKLLVSRDEAAQLLSISARSVDYLVATKRMSTRRIGTRVLIPIEEVRKFARSDHPERMAG